MDPQRSNDVSPEAMQARIQQARREAETLKDRIKRKKDELADATRELCSIHEVDGHCVVAIIIIIIMIMIMMIITTVIVGVNVGVVVLIVSNIIVCVVIVAVGATGRDGFSLNHRPRINSSSSILIIFLSVDSPRCGATFARGGSQKSVDEDQEDTKGTFG